jgi:hypothetical protein
LREAGLADPYLGVSRKYLREAGLNRFRTGFRTITAVFRTAISDRLPLVPKLVEVGDQARRGRIPS